MRPFYDIDNLSMIAREPPVHTRLRTLVNRAFVSRQIEKLRPRVAALANELIDRFEAEGSAELTAAYCTPIPVTVIAELLGVPVEEGPRLAYNPDDGSVLLAPDGGDVHARPEPRWKIPRWRPPRSSWRSCATTSRRAAGTHGTT